MWEAPLALYRHHERRCCTHSSLLARIWCQRCSAVSRQSPAKVMRYSCSSFRKLDRGERQQRRCRKQAHLCKHTLMQPIAMLQEVEVLLPLSTAHIHCTGTFFLDDSLDFVPRGRFTKTGCRLNVLSGLTRHRCCVVLRLPPHCSRLSAAAVRSPLLAGGKML